MLCTIQINICIQYDSHSAEPKALNNKPYRSPKHHLLPSSETTFHTSYSKEQSVAVASRTEARDGLSGSGVDQNSDVEILFPFPIPSPFEKYTIVERELRSRSKRFVARRLRRSPAARTSNTSNDEIDIKSV
jgi:hypothetical protein